MIQYELRVTTAHGEMPTEVMHPSSGAKFPAIIMFMDAPGIRAELRAMARRIAKAGDGGVGCIGFSIGGRFAMQAAGQYPDVVVAAVSVCGSGIVSDKSDSPHRALQGAQAELLFEFAENDAAVPLEHIRTLESTLVSAKRRHAIAIEPGTQHGYVFPIAPPRLKTRGSEYSIYSAGL
jgi:dienelactone hydrolase